MKHWACWAAAALAASTAIPQERPFLRQFTSGRIEQYRVRLVVRSELDGQQAVRRKGATFAEQFARVGGGELGWVITERVGPSTADSTFSVEESLDQFDGPKTTVTAEDEAGKRLAQAAVDSLARWAGRGSRVLRYRANSAGRLLDLPADAAPNLGEAQPPLLTLWLLRALRPSAALPDRPVQFDERWQEPRTVKFAGWEGVEASESGQWLQAADSTEPAARLLLVQQIQGTVVAGPEKPPEGAAQARFHGESIATLSLRDGSLLAASRSANREISWTLSPAQGLLARPEFRARLAAQVEIELCQGPCSRKF